MKRPFRIVALVPHDPDADPRVKWVSQICREFGRTDVFGVTWSSERNRLRYDGQVCVERVDVNQYASDSAKYLLYLLGRLQNWGPAFRYIQREGKRPDVYVEGKPEACHVLWSIGYLPALLDHYIGSFLRFVSAWTYYFVIMNALYRRVRAVSIPPCVCICHDIFALVPGVFLKSKFGCSIIYDSHELWPEAELLAEVWEKRVVKWIEGWLIRRTDAVVTVTPQIARVLEGLYRIPQVLSVPNAEPFRNVNVPSCGNQVSVPVKFLLQGGAAPRRGLEELLHAWRGIDGNRAQLYLRCVSNPYFIQLCEKFSDLVKAGKVVVLPAVGEPELVRAASFADVGVIPYVADSPNHRLSCPNKLSQYMQAGLAILSNDLEFVKEVVTAGDCGYLYDANHPATLMAAVECIVDCPDELQRRKENAHRAARDRFNWDTVSQPYRTQVKAFVERCA